MLRAQGGRNRTLTFVSGGTPKYTTNTYDDLGRVTQATFPDSSHTTYAFHGLSLTVTNALSQATTTVKNAQGLNASVTDANGKTTSFVYDAFGDLKTITDPAGNVTTNTYDIRGRKVASSDPDLGSWTYAYDVLDELTSQTDAKSQTTSLTYDKLGRLTQRTETGLTSTWTYDTATKGIGQIASATGTASSYSRTHTYDTLGRPSTVQLSIDGTPYTYTVTYNKDGGIDTVTYPSGLVLKYVYTTTRNYLSQIKDNTSGTIYWQVSTRDAELHALTQTAGNGIVTTQVFDPNTGLVQQIRAGVSDSVANFSYTFDTIGNLTSRADTYQGYTEKFCYDVLNRVTNYAVASTCTGTGTKTVAYNDIGNITSKSDVGTYSYPTPGSARPHAISSITGTVNGVVNPSYTYDANGNMTAGAGRTVTWTSFNMVDTITQGSSSFAFTYDSEHSRIKQVAPGLTTMYLNALGAMSEKAVGSSTTTWHDFIMADGKMVAERFKVVGGSTTMNYFVSDHLGSIASITNDAGTVTERLSYDAWGKRRNANGTDAACGTITSATTRGFTGHEEIDGACLVDANARIYDPTIGRFMSPDSHVSDALNLQDWNAFTYVNNNPLSFTDPTGHAEIQGCMARADGCGGPPADGFSTTGLDSIWQNMVWETNPQNAPWGWKPCASCDDGQTVQIGTATTTDSSGVTTTIPVYGNSSSSANGPLAEKDPLSVTARTKYAQLNESKTVDSRSNPYSYSGVRDDADKQAALAWNSDKLSDGANLDLHGYSKETDFNVSKYSTNKVSSRNVCVRCFDGLHEGTQFMDQIPAGDYPGHSHTLRQGELPGPGDQSGVQQFGRAYVLTPQGTFAVELSTNGYIVRQIVGESLSGSQMRQLNKVIDQWNQPGGAQCHVVQCY